MFHEETISLKQLKSKKKPNSNEMYDLPDSRFEFF